MPHGVNTVNGVRGTVIGNVVQDRFLVQLDYPAAAASSVLLMVAIVCLVVFYVRRSGTEDLL